VNALSWLGYKTKLALLKVYGPPRLDDEHDPIVQLKEEHGEPTDTDGTHEGG
jgi:hypothetical protein